MIQRLRPNLPTELSLQEMQTRRSWTRHAWDLIGLPFRFVLFPDDWSRRCRWSSLEEERLRAVLPQIRGRLLDIGAGTNRLARIYDGPSIGVDVYDFGGGATIIEDTRHLPFEANSFDTVTFVACLNHIPYREEALLEARRVLRPGGRIVATMIGRWIGEVGHKVWWYSEDKERGMLEGETGGLNTAEMLAFLRNAGFVNVEHTTFCYGLNSLYVATRPGSV